MSNKNSASLIVKLEGEHAINVNTLINMLTHYVVIANRANDIAGEGEYKAEVRVKALNEGSFEISLELVTTWLQNLLSRENVNYAASVVTLISGVFGLYKLFKGRKIKEEQLKDLHVEYHNTTVINVYNDPATSEAMRRSFETASLDPSVSGITLVANGEPSVTIGDDEFPELIHSGVNDEIPQTRSLVGTATLLITSLSFNKGDTWRFIYQGNKIATKMSDDALQKAIDSGASFAKGDALEVQLETTQIWSSDYKAYLNHRYKVLQVLKHIKAEQQAELFPNDAEG